LTENIYILLDNQLDYLSFRVGICFAFRGQYICEFVNILRVCVTCAWAIPTRKGDLSFRI